MCFIELQRCGRYRVFEFPPHPIANFTLKIAISHQVLILLHTYSKDTFTKEPIMSTNKEFADALTLARPAYISEIEQGEAIAKPAFEAAAAAYTDQALATCAIAQLRFNLLNSFFTLALDEFNQLVADYNENELTDPQPIYQALAKCTVALEVSFSDISEYEAALEIFRSASPAGEHMYPELMEALLDVAENREIIAAEITESTTWLINKAERYK
jgi:hypothetical protein